MTLPLSTKPIIGLSNSSDGELDYCPRKYQLRKRFLHPDNKFDDSLAAMGGRAIHCYIQSIMAGATEDEAAWEFFKEWDFSIEAADSPWNQQHRSMEACYRTATALTKQLNINATEIAQFQVGDEIKKGIEVKFNIIISHTKWDNDYHYRGAIDLVTWHDYHQMFTVYDIKTHRNPTSENTFRYKWDTQTIPYGLVIAHLSGQDITNFAANYILAYVDIIEPTSELIPFNRTKEDIQYWIDSIYRRIRDVEYYYKRDVWPRSVSGCNAYNKPCRFWKLCDIADPVEMQRALLYGGEAQPVKPFGEWITLNLPLDEVYPNG